jgi:citrate synthase
MLLCAAVCDAPVGGPIDAALAAAWLGTRAVIPPIRGALILCADHELNVSTFTARCIASARATPYEAVLGALAALRGRRHGGATEDVERLFREGARAHRARDVLGQHLRSSGGLAGFGHPAYPKGDPRAQALIGLARKYGARSACDAAEQFIQAARRLTGDFPNLDFGLVTLARALGLPPDAPIALFALGRTIGWIAHAIEQYADTRLIRPRAKYIGSAPFLSDAPQARGNRGKAHGRSDQS